MSTVAYARAERRLFHGWLKQQLALTLVCFWRGHEWGRGVERDGVVHRPCTHGCGTRKLTSTRDISVRAQ